MSEDIKNSNNKRKAGDIGDSHESEPPSKLPKTSENEQSQSQENSQLTTALGNSTGETNSYSTDVYYDPNAGYSGYMTTDYTTSMYPGYPYYYSGISSTTYSSPSVTNVSSYPSYPMNYSSYSPPSLSLSSISTNISTPTSTTTATTTTTTTSSLSSVVNTATTDSNVNSTETNPETGVDESSKDASTKKKNKNPYLKKFRRYAAGEVWEDPTLAEWPENDFRIFVGNIANDVSDNLLYTTFASKYSSTVKAKVIRDKRTGRAKYGFVSLMDPQEFVRALKEMNGKYIGSHPVALKKSTWKERSLEKQREKQREKRKLFKK